MSWVAAALLAALCAGITSILAKCGVRDADSDIATGIRTAVVLIFAWLVVFVTDAQVGMGNIAPRSWIFLIASGIATGASWLCYFKALSLGDVNKVVPVDKSSAVLAMILAFVFLNETITRLKCLCLTAIAAGTYMMIEKKSSLQTKEKGAWLLLAVLSALFAAASSILGKIGIDGVESNFGTFIRTGVVLVMSWFIVLAKGKGGKIKSVSLRELLFIVLSGIATGASWLCYFKALKDGQASAVIAIDKLSIIVTVSFSYLVFKEKLTLKSFTGLILIVAGTLCMLI